MTFMMRVLMLIVSVSLVGGSERSRGQRLPPKSSRDPQVGSGSDDPPEIVANPAAMLNGPNVLADTVANWLAREFEEDDEMELRRVRRDVMDILSSIPGVAQLMGNPNVAAIVSAIMSILRDALSYFQCCETVATLPPGAVDSLMQCAQEPALNFVTNVTTRYAASTDAEKMVQPPVDGSEISDLLQQGMCTTHCAFEKLQMLSADGLPSSNAIADALKRMKFSAKQMALAQPAAVACRAELSRAQNSTSSGELSPIEKCWSANMMLGCMQRNMVEHCPDKQRKQGVPCVMKLAGSFLKELPRSARELKDSIMTTVFGFINSILSPSAQPTKSI